MANLTPNKKQYGNRPNRSDAYQYVIHEIPCSTDFLASFDYLSGYQGKFAQESVSEEYQELLEEIIKLVWETIEQKCTDRQKQVLTMYFKEGMTQWDIAKKLGCNQSSVTKSLWGNGEYSKDKDCGGKPTFYGGSFKKIRKILSADPHFMELMQKLYDLRQESL